LPSQVWYWMPGETIAELLDRARHEHWMQYGPIGKFRDVQILGEDKFMHATEKISRFILGALLWLNQKLAPLELVDGHVERHARKDFDRHTGTEKLDKVRVVQLRKRATATHEPTEGESKREYSVRWIVEGHIRNQPVGPGRRERKLIWIDAYVKGPDDKPMKIAAPKVYDVSR